MAGEAGDIMDITEASEYLRIKKRTLYSLVSRGVIPGIKVGGQWRFKREMLDALFSKGQESPFFFRERGRIEVAR